MQINVKSSWGIQFEKLKWCGLCKFILLQYNRANDEIDGERTEAMMEQRKLPRESGAKLKLNSLPIGALPFLLICGGAERFWQYKVQWRRVVEQHQSTTYIGCNLFVARTNNTLQSQLISSNIVIGEHHSHHRHHHHHPR